MLAFKTTTFKQLSSCPSTSFVLFTFRAFHVFTIYQAGNSDKNILPATFVSLRQKSFSMPCICTVQIGVCFHFLLLYFSRLSDRQQSSNQITG